MSEATHTPTPWTIEPSDGESQGEWHYWAIKGERGNIATIGAASQRGPIDMESNQANAAFVVRAANAHDDLVHALRLLHDNLAEYQRINQLGGYDNQDMQIARAALAKAGAAP